MKIGYVCVSKQEQHEALQRDMLKKVDYIVFSVLISTFIKVGRGYFSDDLKSEMHGGLLYKRRY